MKGNPSLETLPLTCICDMCKVSKELKLKYTSFPKGRGNNIQITKMISFQLDIGMSTPTPRIIMRYSKYVFPWTSLRNSKVSFNLIH